jgi:hypothetical protein
MQMSSAGNGAPKHLAEPFFIKRCSDKGINVDKRKTITTTDEGDMRNYDTSGVVVANMKTEMCENMRTVWMTAIDSNRDRK